MQTRATGLAAVLAFAVVTAFAGAAIAGPPFVADDPEPTDPDRWEVYAFAAATRAAEATEGEAGLDVNYGAARDLQVTLDLPLAFEHDGASHAGLGDVELAAKYRFLHQRDGEPIPDVAFFPRFTLPTGGQRFGAGHMTLFLPLWAQKDFGAWSVFGGGGYQIHLGGEGRNNWLAAMAATRQLTDRWLLGAEIYHETPDERGSRPFTGLNLGTVYRLTERWSVLASAGPGIQNSRQGRFAVYIGLKADY